MDGLTQYWVYYFKFVYTSRIYIIEEVKGVKIHQQLGNLLFHPLVHMGTQQETE